MKESTNKEYPISYDSLFLAYMECWRHKAWTEAAAAFEIHYESGLLRLKGEIERGEYVPGPSITFLVQWPTTREVFAAMFRDRVVQTWVAQRIEPLFETQFVPWSYNCRKGKGTTAAIKRLHEAIREKSEGYARDCWVLKYDLKGFFMSINREMVTDKLCRFLDERYKGADKETLLWLTRVTLMNDPAANCVRQGNPRGWDALPANKSLFTVPEGHGLPIGNITSQLVANFLLDDTDHYMSEVLGLAIDRYVDDTATVDTDKERLLLAMPLIREHLWQTARVRVNPKKYYLQHYTKGVKFLGAVIKGERIYTGNRTVGKAMCKLHGYNMKAKERGAAWCKAEAENFVASVNSYLGLMRQGCEYGLRRRYCGMIGEEWLRYVVVAWDFTKITLIKKYKRRERIRHMLERKRKKANIFKTQKAKRMTARVFSGSDNVPATVEQFNTGRKRGCIVRWDFETVKTIVPEGDKRANFKQRKAAEKSARAARAGNTTPPVEPQADVQPQGVEVDTRMVAYSEMRYFGVPDWEKVKADMEFDLTLRHGEPEAWPEIDWERYRTELAALNGR